MKDLLEEVRGWGHRFGLPSLVVIACLTLSSLAIANLSLVGPPNWEPYEVFRRFVQFSLLVAALFGLFGVIVTLGYVAINRFWLRHNVLRVVAWEGYGEEGVLRTLPEKKAVEVLEYVRGLGNISSLRIRGEPFDLLITDAEFLAHQHSGRWLVPLSQDNFKSHGVDAATYRKNVSPIWIGDSAFGVPLRWAPNDIIWSQLKAPDFEVSDYRDLLLDSLLQVETAAKIGLWNWYLPTLQILSLAWYQAQNCKADEKVNLSNFSWHTNIGRYVISDHLVSPIKEHRDRFRLINSPAGIRDALSPAPVEEDSCWIVLGAGSWALGRESPPDILTRHPASGVTVWLECASLLATQQTRGTVQHSSKSRHQDLVNRTLEALTETDTQLALARCESYAAMPSTSAAMQAIVQQDGTSFVRSAVQLLDETNKALVAEKFLPRQLPKDRFLWEAEWAALQEAIR